MADDLIQFDAASGERIARAVRTVESQHPPAKPLSFAPLLSNEFKIAIAKARGSVMPGDTALFDIYTGFHGYEVFSGRTATAFVRHVSVVPDEYVSLSKIDGGQEVSGGGYQIRSFQGITHTWAASSSAVVYFDGGGSARVFNNLATIDADQTSLTAAFFCAYFPDDVGRARWRLITAPPGGGVRIANFAGSWASGATHTIQFATSKETAVASNPFESIIPAFGQTSVCSVAWANGEWHVIEKRRQESVRLASFSGQWPSGKTATIGFASGITATAFNPYEDIAELPDNKTAVCSVAFSDDRWHVVEKSRKPESVFRVCQFTDAWPINQSKVVTLKNQTDTPTAVTAVNLFASVNGQKDGSDGFVARDGTSWFLVGVNLTQQDGYYGDRTQVLGHDKEQGGLIKWYDVTSCTATA